MIRAFRQIIAFLVGSILMIITLGRVEINWSGTSQGPSSDEDASSPISSPEDPEK